MTSDESTNQLLGMTAQWTAAVRARENKREDRLFVDPWAASLVGEAGAKWIDSRTDDSVLPIVLRTCFFDDFLQRVSTHFSITQIVLVAAGLDTRAFRLPWSKQIQIFELDQPSVLAYKEQVLQSAGAIPSCSRHTVAADLSHSWIEKLDEAGFRQEKPACWLLEGFLFYLPNDQLIRILDDIAHLAAPGSWMGFDVVNSIMLTSSITHKWIEMQANSGAPWIGVMDDPTGFLAERGWKAAITQAGAEDANYGRWTFPIIPVLIPDMPHNWFVTAQKL